MDPLEGTVDTAAEGSSLSGVVRVDRDGETEFARAYGLADRAHEIPNSVDTRFAIASGTKGLTALAVMSLVEDGTLTLTTTARSVLGYDLPLIDDGVTIEHLLAHRSGIGDTWTRRRWTTSPRTPCRSRCTNSRRRRTTSPP